MSNNCTLFKRSLFLDIPINSFTVQQEWISSLIPAYNPEYSGLWMPVIIKPEQTNIEYVDIFTRADTEQKLFNPCNCNIPDTNDEEDEENAQSYCEYCTTDINHNFAATWTLKNNAPDPNSKVVSNIVSSCCNGACDVRMSKDDYLAKLPSLNSTYLDKFYDFKYKKQFPACSNLGLGKEKLIYSNSYDSFSNDSPELVIDWKIKERLTEIPPDVNSYHKNYDTHDKSYKRSLMNSKTCGNFLLTKINDEHLSIQEYYPITSGVIGNIANTGNYKALLPLPKNFTKPYGFQNQDHYNIFVKTEKVGSHWKWNYTSGILCWYRYFNVGASKDNRMIPGVDLYISDGDVFYAKNDGPEETNLPSKVLNQSPNSLIPHSCPSGLKLIKNGVVTGVLPNNSDFIYISENIYSKFYSIINKLENLEVSLDVSTADKITPIKKMELAALLATGPNYHEVTIDLLKTVKDLDDPTKDYQRDPYKYITIFNKAMLHKEQCSLKHLNLVKTSGDLINTLADKYGTYVWFPPNTTKTLTSKKDYNNHAYIDMDFEPVVKQSDTIFPVPCKDRPVDCSDPTVSKTFAYDQKIILSNFIFNTSVDNKYKNYICESGNFTIDKSAYSISAYFNNSLIKEAYYGSGCTRFSQKYLRFPSYDLALKLKGDRELCSNNWLCNEENAKKWNNNLEVWGTPTERKAGQFDDSSVLLDRKYPANYCNVNIDRIGFNNQGGVYYDSNIFGSGNVVFISNNPGSSKGQLKISFMTKNIGIKLYSLELFKLRDKDNSECKTFPLDQSCKCFPLSYMNGYQHNCNGQLVFSNTANILYTPNLSTQNSPTIKAYGGFSISEVEDILGTSRIPNHPDIQADIGTVNRIIDPLNPYDCEESISVNFPNYIYTNWSIVLPKQYTTSHADVWIKINENVSLTQKTLVKETNDGEDEFEIVPNPNYRRYTTKAEIRSKTFYGSQQDILFEKNASVGSINIELTNPFLYSLISQMSTDINKEKVAYTPLPCSLDVNRNNPDQDPLDPYLVKSLGFVFARLPRKQILAYKFQPLSSISSLSRAFFHPNSGLISDEDFKGKTPLLFDAKTCAFDFDYEKPVFASGSIDYSTSGVVFTGIITKSVKRILDSVNTLSSHKKLRLYIKYNNNWYEYTNPHVFGFFNKHNNSIYPSYPLFFEYTKEDKYKTQLYGTIYTKDSPDNDDVVTEPSILIPASAKNNIKFKYYYNHFNNLPTTQDIKDTLPNNGYPIFNELFTIDKDANNKIVIPGTRAYFFIPEEDKATKIESLISGMSETVQETIHRHSIILDKNNNRWRYKGEGSKTDEASYERMALRDYRDDNFSEEYITYGSTNKKGYVRNTNVKTKPTKVKLISSSNRNITQTYTIKSKAIYAPKTDRYGNAIPLFDAIKPRQYLKVSTVLELSEVCAECDIPIREGYVQIIDPSPPSDYNTPQSFVLFQDLKGLIRSEYDALLNNKFTNTKWGDVLNYDHKLFSDLNNSQIIHTIIEKIYPSSLYDNMFHSMIINNTNTGNFNAMITTTDSSGQNKKSGVINYTGSVYYNIHQIYNIGLDKYLENIVDNYKNYLPFIDINFLDNTYIQSQPWYDNIKENYDQHLVANDNIYISGIRGFADIKILQNNPESGSSFFVCLDNNQYLQPVLFDKEFYYDSLRIDDVYYRLSSLSKEEAYDNNGYRAIFKPNISFGSKTLPDYFNTQAFCPSPINPFTFENIPIYGDIDRSDKCNNTACSMSNFAGSTKLKAGYSHYEYPFIKANVLSEKDNLEYAISVDEGLYNIVGNNSLPYIQRFEIEPKSNLFPNTTLDKTTQCVKGGDSRPSRPQNYIDFEYQTKLKTYILSENDKGSLVSTTDQLANEMLFRLIYGSKQKINYDSIKKQTIQESIKYKINNALSYLLQYADPKITPDLIYKFIPYDYATSSDVSKRKISGTISINGVLAVGKSVSVKIGNSVVSINIQKINGKIYAVGSCNGIQVKGLIHDEDNITKGLFTHVLNGSPAPVPPDARTTFRLLATCVVPDSKNWSKGKHFSSVSYATTDENGNQKETSIAGEFLKCLTRVAKENKCVNHIDWGNNPPDASVLNSGFVDCIGTPPCVGCLSRGWAPGIGKNYVIEDGKVVLRGELGPGCSVIYNSSHQVGMGGYARGSFGTGNVFGDCAARQTAFTSVAPCSYDGDFDAYMSSLAVMNKFAASLSCGTAQPKCGSVCAPLDFSDIYGEVYNPKRSATSPGYAAICECQPYNYGYCSVPDDTCQCLKYAEGFPKIFKYDFEYCNYNFTQIQGHITRYEDGSLPTWNGKGAIYSVACETEELNGEGGGGKATEVCYWIECVQNNPDVNIYESTTINPTPYVPLCPTSLCSITYDNNTITLNLTGAETKCFTNIIRNNCPEITITLPDSTFSFTDSIDSQCTECSVDKNAIVGPDSQNPDWDIITETRTAILGTLPIEGDFNRNIMAGGGATYVDKSLCGAGVDEPCCCDNCYRSTGGLLQCGQSAPGSWVWFHALACEIPGSPGPLFHKCKQRVSNLGVTNVKSGLIFAQGSDNGTVKGRVIDQWKIEMTAKYKTYSPCFNGSERTVPENSINVDDLVEGVVPGSCSPLAFGMASYPIIAWKSTPDGGTSSRGSLGVHYAYFTYQYRRPKTIQDILLGENASKCATVVPIDPVPGYNITEKYIINRENCSNVPTCSDIKPEVCDDTSYCCRTGYPGGGVQS